MSYTKLYKRVQKQEIIDAILVEMRKKPKITNMELSINLKLHRHTISKYRKYIRQNYYKTPEEIVNKIDSRLEDELEAMSHFALLTYRAQLVPRKAEIRSTQEIHERREISIDLSLYTDDEKSILDKAARLLDRKSKGKSESLH